MARVEFDTTELDRWTDVLARGPVMARTRGRAIVTKGAVNIKTEARANAPHGPHTPHYRNSITFDITETPVEIMAEIGPEMGRRQWGLGSLIEYGSQHNLPHPHHEPALDHEEPRFIAACEKVAAEAIGLG